MIYLSDDLTEAELSDARDEQRKLRMAARIAKLRELLEPCDLWLCEQCASYRAELRKLGSDACEGGDGPCPNACKCGCDSGLYVCECWV